MKKLNSVWSWEAEPIRGGAPGQTGRWTAEGAAWCRQAKKGGWRIEKTKTETWR